jgi:anti-sigma regulatory factor (Ser/Thr protein kinase)
VPVRTVWAVRVVQAQLEIGADPAEVGRARRWARSRLVACGIGRDEPLAETLLLLISELVTNAVVHTGTPSVLRVLLPGRQTQGAVRVEVADMSACPPRHREAGGEDDNGRGLELVSGLADRWGWQREGHGKRIWCELDRAAAVGHDPLPARQLTAGVGGGPDMAAGAVTAASAGISQGVLPG